jgi:hypothetical protein
MITYRPLSYIQVVDEYQHVSSRVTSFTLVVNIQHDLMKEFTGFASRHPDDKDDKDVALLKAQADAYEKLARSLRRRSDGLIKHASHSTFVKDSSEVDRFVKTIENGFTSFKNNDANIIDLKDQINIDNHKVSKKKKKRSI